MAAAHVAGRYVEGSQAGIVDLHITAHHVGLLVLIDIWMDREQEVPENVWAKKPSIDVQEGLASLLLRHIQHPSMEEPLLVDFVQDIRKTVGNARTKDEVEEVLSLLTTRLALSTPDDVLMLFHERLKKRKPGNSMDPGRVAKTSPLGLFVRRMHHVMNRTLFGGLIVLFERLQVYSRESLTPKKEKEEVGPFPKEFLPGGWDEKVWKDANVRFEKKYGVNRGGLGMGELNEALGTFAREIDATAGRVGPPPLLFHDHERDFNRKITPRVFYLQYLSCLYLREFEGAVENLHRYFDVCIRALGEKRRGEGSRMLIPYAVLNMAALHTRFEHYPEALSAIEETVRVAQENNDSECLARALVWLFVIVSRGTGAGMNWSVSGGASGAGFEGAFVDQRSRSGPPRSVGVDKTSLLQRSEDLVTEMELVELQRLVSMARVADGLKHGRDGSTVDAVHTALAKSQTGFNIEKDMRELCGLGALIRSGAWKLHGSSSLSLMEAEWPLVLGEERNSKNSTVVPVEEIAHALARIAVEKEEMGQQKEAEAALHQLQTQVPHTTLPMLPLASAFVAHHRACLREEWRKADVVSEALIGLCPKEAGDRVGWLDMRHRKARALLLEGRHREAHEEALELLRLAESHNIPHLVASLATTGAEALLLSGAPAAALPLALQAASVVLVSEDASQAGDVARTAAVVGRVQLELGWVDRAQETLERVMPLVLGEAPLEQRMDVVQVLSRVRLEQGQPKMALSLVQDAAAWAEKIGCQRGMQEAWKGIARAEHALMQKCEPESESWKEHAKRREQAALKALQVPPVKSTVDAAYPLRCW